MKISPLSVRYNSRLNFGYNTKYHREVIKKLSANNDIRAKYAIQNEKHLLKVEDKIIKMEKEGDSFSEEYNDLVDYLLEEKPVHAYEIELIDGDLKYCDNLIQNYLTESKKSGISYGVDWRETLSQKLNAYTVYDYFPQEKAASQEQHNNTEKEELQKCILSTFAKVNKANENENINSLMTLYEPNQFSPRSLDDVIGSEEIKEKIREDIMPYTVSPTQAAEDYNEYGIRAPRGFLFYGPPGCGKTYLTQAFANETGIQMYMMDVSKVGSMYVNKTANNIRDAFEYIFEKAKESQKPVIIFMDEVDALAMKRDESASSSGENQKSTTTLLKMVEAARDNNVIIIAATNRYDILDKAFKDRFDGQIYFPLPDKDQIVNLLTVSLLLREKGAELASEDENIDKLANMLKGYSNRSIMIILDDAAKIARRRSRDNITFNDVKTAIEKTELEKSNENDYLKLSKRKHPIGFSSVV